MLKIRGNKKLSREARQRRKLIKRTLIAGVILLMMFNANADHR